MNILEDLQFRGLLYQSTDEKELADRLNAGPISLYIGFDPTADSLHVGSLLPIVGLMRFQRYGHHPIALVGGGTGLIGDPSGKTAARGFNAEDIVDQWTEKIRLQLERFLDFEAKSNPARMVNNYSWLGNMEMIRFLRDVGKYFSIGYMLSKESVKARLEEGITYTEFSYMILQSYDFLNLFREYDCEMQAGGSDQWGNITAGIELIRRIANKKAYGLTFPLVMKSDGTKFGKTEAGTIWLDAAKTTPYQFYQFWINSDDRDVLKFIKYFTFLPPEEIKELEEQFRQDPGSRKAQRVLAREVTEMVHGKEAFTRAEHISEALFYGNLKDLTSQEIEEGFVDVPSYTVQEKEEIRIIDLLLQAGISPSKRQAREDIRSGAIYLNGETVKDVELVVGKAERLQGHYTIIRRGKKNYNLIRWG